jgi:hypothetical protein
VTAGLAAFKPILAKFKQLQKCSNTKGTNLPGDDRGMHPEAHKGYFYLCDAVYPSVVWNLLWCMANFVKITHFGQG